MPDTPFHGQRTVAPLKHVRICQRPRRRQRFPRSKNRGPIEAFSRRGRSHSRACFPRSKNRGPIEAGNGWTAAPVRRPLSTVKEPWPH